VIRNFQSTDALQLLDLLARNTPEFFSPEEADDFKKYLTKEVEQYFVVERNGVVVGSGGINYFLKEGEARISWDVIHPDFQGQGIGRQLTTFRINRIKAHPEIKKIIVRTSQKVYPFYEKMGFTLIKIEKDFWAKGLDLYEMHIEL